jgi:hypothetical protein
MASCLAALATSGFAAVAGAIGATTTADFTNGEFVRAEGFASDTCTRSFASIVVLKEDFHRNASGTPARGGVILSRFFVEDVCDGSFLSGSGFAVVPASTLQLQVSSDNTTASLNATLGMDVCDNFGVCSTETAVIALAEVADGFIDNYLLHERSRFPDGSSFDERVNETFHRAVPSGTMTVGSQVLPFNDFAGFGRFTNGAVSFSPPLTPPR